MKTQLYKEMSGAWHKLGDLGRLGGLVLTSSLAMIGCTTGASQGTPTSDAQTQTAERSVLDEAFVRGRLSVLPETLEVRELPVSPVAQARHEALKAGEKPVLVASGPAFDAGEAGHYQRSLQEALPVTPGLRLQASTAREDFVMGEPVSLRLTLENTSDRPRRFPTLLDPQFQYNHVLVTTPSGRLIGYSPVAIACSRGELQFETLAPGDTRTADVSIHFHKDGWLFSEVGEYRIQSLFRGTTADAERVDSNIVTITVHPGSERDQQAARLMMGHQQGLFTMWGEGDHLEDAIASLEELVARYPETTLATHARYALGSNLSTDFFDGRYNQERQAQPGAALGWLLPVVDQLRVGTGPELAPDMVKGAFIKTAQDYVRMGQKTSARAVLQDFLRTQALNPDLGEADLAEVNDLLTSL